MVINYQALVEKMLYSVEFWMSDLDPRFAVDLSHRILDSLQFNCKWVTCFRSCVSSTGTYLKDAVSSSIQCIPNRGKCQHFPLNLLQVMHKKRVIKLYAFTELFNLLSFERILKISLISNERSTNFPFTINVNFISAFYSEL